MKNRVELDPQVAGFVRALAPDPRKCLRDGLRGLEEEKGDLKQLEGELAGYACAWAVTASSFVFSRRAVSGLPAASSPRSGP